MATFVLDQSSPFNNNVIEVDEGSGYYSVYLEGQDDAYWPKYDTTGTKSLTDISVGDKLQMTMEAGPSFDGTGDYDLPLHISITIFDENLEDVVWSMTLAPADQSVDTVELNGVYDLDTVSVTVYYAGNNTYSIRNPLAPAQPTYELDGTQLAVGKVHNLGEGFTTELIVQSNGDIWDTTGTATLRDITRGSKIILRNLECDNTIVGVGANYTSVNLTVYDDYGQSIIYGKYLYSQQASDYIDLTGKQEGDLVDFDVYYISEHGYSVAPPAQPSTSFVLDGYTAGDTIYVPLNETIRINYDFLPSGSEPVWAYLGTSYTGSYISAQANEESGQYYIAIDGLNAGSETLTLSLSVEGGGHYTQEYNVAVFVPAEDFSLNGLQQGGTISMRQSSNAKTYDVIFSPQGGMPETFAVVSSNTSVATATYADGVVTVAPVSAGTATLTVTMDAGLVSEVVYTYTISIEPPLADKALGGNAVAFFKAKLAEAGGGVTKLSEADYDSEDGNSQPCLYLGNLEPGMYQVESNAGYILAEVYPNDISWQLAGYVFVTQWPNPWNESEEDKTVFTMEPDGDLYKLQYYRYDGGGWNSNGSSSYATSSDVYAQIGQYVGQIGNQPTSSTWGSVGCIYKRVSDRFDPDTGDWLGQDAELWLCAGVDYDPDTGEETYNWAQIYPTNPL